MPLRIAFDLDGVLGDMEAELVRQAEVLFGEPMTRRLQERASEGGAVAPAAAADDTPAGTAPEGQAAAEAAPDNVPALLHLNMTSRQQRRLWRHVESIENLWEHLEEIEAGAVQRLATVAHERRWDVIVLTKRPETVGAIAQVQSQRWLEARGFTLPSVYASRARAVLTLSSQPPTRFLPRTGRFRYDRALHHGENGSRADASPPRSASTSSSTTVPRTASTSSSTRRRARFWSRIERICQRVTSRSG